MPTTYAIPNGRTVMDATTYSGNATAGTNITNAASFKPDFVWIKNRTNSTDHILTDSVRGVTKTLFSDLTVAEITVAGGLTAFNSNGFQVGFDGSNIVNNTSNAYVGWQWQAGQGTTSSNTSGILTSTVSVNASAGFSVVTYTAPSSSQANSFGHGLGVAPAFVIAKNRSSGTGGLGWAVYHQSLGANQYLSLNSTAAASTYSGYWGSGMNSTTVGLPTCASSTGFDNCTGNMVAYCWAPVAGFSQFGSYTGNGSSSGPFVYCGFRPRFVMIKRTDSAGYYWFMLDAARNTYNAVNSDLYANSSSAEASPDNALDFLSNGFRPTDSNTGTNGNGGNFIYAAFAENPFKYANAR